MKKIVILIAMMIGILGIANNVYAVTGTTNAETTRLREQANSDSRTLTLISINEEIEIMSKEGEWYKVVYNGIEGYIYAELLDVTETVVDNSVSGEENNTNTEAPNEEQTNFEVTNEGQEPNKEETPNEEQPSKENEN